MTSPMQRPQHPATKTSNCAIYTRVSTEEQAEGDFSSPAAQHAICLRFIESHQREGWVASPVDYSDPGVSGKSLKRPGIQKLLADINQGRVQKVVIYKFDRISRDHKDSQWLMDFFKKHKVDLYADSTLVDYENPEGWFMTSMQMILAQRERMVTSKRTKDKILEARRLGFWTGGHVPLGYDRKDKKKLVPNAAEARLVRFIFTTYLKLQSLDRAMEVINTKHLTKKWVTAEGRTVGGRKFAKTTLFHILKNRLYLGEISHGDQWVKGKHEAIVPAEVFAKAQELMARNGHSRTSASRSVLRNTHRRLLRGLVRCDACGAMMTSYHSHGRGDLRYDYYKCTRGQHGGAEACRVKQVAAGELEGLVLARIAEIAADIRLVRRAAQRANAGSQGRRPAKRSELAQATAKRRKIEADANALLQTITGTAAQNNTLVATRLNELEAALREAQGQETRLRAEVEAQQVPTIDPAQAQRDLTDFHRLYKHMGPQDRQRLLGLTIREVRYNGLTHEMQLSLHPLRDGGSASASVVRTGQFGSPG